MAEATFENIKVWDDPDQCKKLLLGSGNPMRFSYVFGALTVRGDVFEVEGEKRRVILPGVTSVELRKGIGKIKVVYWPDGEPTRALLEAGKRSYGALSRGTPKLFPRLKEALVPKQLSKREEALRAKRLHAAVRGGASKGRNATSESVYRAAEERGWPSLTFTSAHEDVTTSAGLGTITTTRTTSFRENHISGGQRTWEEWLEQLSAGGEGVRGAIWGGARSEYLGAVEFALVFDGDGV